MSMKKSEACQSAMLYRLETLPDTKPPVSLKTGKVLGNQHDGVMASRIILKT